MAFEHIYLLGKVELDVIATGASHRPDAGGTLTIQSDIPGRTLADRTVVNIPASTRRVVQKRLPYSLQGHLFRFLYRPGIGTARLYGVRVWARELPNGQWQWYRLPVVDTPNEWSTVKLEIPATGEWAPIKLEIPPTGDWNTVKVSIPPTSDDWNTVKLQVPPTNEEWRDFKIPMKPTPPLPDWVSLEVDQ